MAINLSHVIEKKALFIFDCCLPAPLNTLNRFVVSRVRSRCSPACGAEVTVKVRIATGVLTSSNEQIHCQLIGPTRAGARAYFFFWPKAAARAADALE